MDPTSEPLGIAIVGCGTVGGAVAHLLTSPQNGLKQSLKRALKLKAIVDVDFSKAKALGLNPELFFSDINKVLADPEVEVICELVGGTTVAKEITMQALQAGKYVVTANKALLATYGNELLALARRQKRAILFEASCAGGIPIIRALYDGLIANQIKALFGIVNGTCNYILTRMTQAGKSYAEALAEAQTQGFAEQDPYLDVSGLDSAHKLAILSALAFKQPIDLARIKVEGIDKLSLSDLQYGDELGYTIKLLAIAQRQDDGLYTAVKPAFITKAHPLAWVSGPFNAVSVYGDATGHTMYYGRGAGGFPTASAVLADLATLALGKVDELFAGLRIWPDLVSPTDVLSSREAKSRFYIRMIAEDQAGVLAQIASVFGRYHISLSSVLQKEKPETVPANTVPVVITTHATEEPTLRAALDEIDRLAVIHGQSVCIAILDEHQE